MFFSHCAYSQELYANYSSNIGHSYELYFYKIQSNSILDHQKLNYAKLHIHENRVNLKVNIVTNDSAALYTKQLVSDYCGLFYKITLSGLKEAMMKMGTELDPGLPGDEKKFNEPYISWDKSEVTNISTNINASCEGQLVY